MDFLRGWDSVSSQNSMYPVLDGAPRWPYLFFYVVVLLITKSVASHLWRSFRERKKGYGAIPRFPQLDPVLGLDVAYSQVACVKKHTLLRWLGNFHAAGKARTVSYHQLGTRFIHTTEPENMRAMFASPVWKDFGVAPLRRNNRATMPFADKGVGTVDGHEWEVSRSLIKPYFGREASNNTQRLEEHTGNLLSLVPTDGSTFDMQELAQRWFLDTSTHFMFGESIGCLLHPERAQVAWAMTDVLRGLRFRLMMVRWLFLFRHQPWFDAIDVVHSYINRLIDTAYADYAKKEQRQQAAEAAADGAEKSGNGSTTTTTAPTTTTTTAVEETDERTDLLWQMIPHFGQDKERLRSELLVLFAPNNDTTSILLSNVFWNLARRPDVYAKIRADVLAHDLDAPLTYERLRSMKYLDAVLNETHRLYPVNLTQTRTALQDSTLPLGGGKDEKSPIYIRKGDVLRVNKATMFRDKELWGEDAEEFKPERFLGLTPSWKFMPFGGGPRRCPAQAMATNEASHCVASFARRFKAIENRDANVAYTPIIRVSPVHKNGVQIAAVPA